MELRRAFLKDTEAVAYLRERGVDLSRATMRNWRSYGKSGLRFHKIGGKIYYSIEDLDHWLNQNRFAEGGRRDPRIPTSREIVPVSGTSPSEAAPIPAERGRERRAPREGGSE
jgi:hypothetical protein